MPDVGWDDVHLAEIVALSHLDGIIRNLSKKCGIINECVCFMKDFVDSDGQITSFTSICVCVRRPRLAAKAWSSSINCAVVKLFNFASLSLLPLLSLSSLFGGHKELWE